MSERLEERRREIIQEAAHRYNENKKMIREFIGPGGVKLDKTEQQQLYQDALNDPEMMLGTLQNRQAARKLPPDMIPRDWVEWLEEMREATTEASSKEPQLPSMTRQRRQQEL